eukprot:9031-Heterococcus_DN1.PRE.1
MPPAPPASGHANGFGNGYGGSNGRWVWQGQGGSDPLRDPLGPPMARTYLKLLTEAQEEAAAARKQLADLIAQRNSSSSSAAAASGTDTIATTTAAATTASTAAAAAADSADAGRGAASVDAAATAAASATNSTPATTAAAGVETQGERMLRQLLDASGYYSAIAADDDVDIHVSMLASQAMFRCALCAEHTQGYHARIIAIIAHNSASQVNPYIMCTTTYVLMLHRRKLDGMRANIARLRARGEVRNEVHQSTAITAYSFCIASTGPLVHAMCMHTQPLLHILSIIYSCYMTPRAGYTAGSRAQQCTICLPVAANSAALPGCTQTAHSYNGRSAHAERSWPH